MAEITVSRLTVLEKSLAVVTALLALGTGFLGYKTATINQAKNQVQAAAVDTHNDLSSLQTKYDALQAENERLRAQLGLPGPTADVQPPTTATVHHSGHLVLAVGGRASLDSPSFDPQWQVTGSSGFDIEYDGSAIEVSTSDTALYLGDRKVDYQTCRSTTGYSARSFKINSVTPGSYICIKTSEKRYSALRIAQIDSSNVTFDIVTYDPPDN
jgi:hypothetical protein